MIDGTVLAYIPSPAQGVWHLGPIPLRAYALCIVVGIIVAVWWGSRRWQARGGQAGEVIDVALWAVPFGLIGGRLYHVLTDWSTYFGADGKGLLAAFQIWEGGLGIWGAVAFGALGAWIGARSLGIKLPPFGDALAPAILLAQAIGRLGNYFNQELTGRPTDVPWGLEIFNRVAPNGQMSPKLVDGVSTGQVVEVVHPTFLYEMLWNIVIVIVLVLLDRRFRIGHGRLFAMYVAGYCVGRFAIELMRDDFATHIFGVRINVFTAAIVFLCAALYVVLAPRGREEGLEVYRPEKAAEILADDPEAAVTPEAVDPETADASETAEPETAGVSSEADAAVDAEDIEVDADADAGVPIDERSAESDVDDSVWAKNVDSPEPEPQPDPEPALDDSRPDDDGQTDGSASETAAEENAAEENGTEETAAEDTAEGAEQDTAEEAARNHEEEAVAAIVDASGESSADAIPEEQMEDDTPVADEPAQPETRKLADRVIPSRDPEIVDSISSQGYTVVAADDDELSGITVIEQYPGGSAGAIEIRRTPDAAEDEDRGDTPDSDS